MSLLRRLVDAAKGKHPLAAKRSPKWPEVRAAHLSKHPCCEVCGGTTNLEVHHKVPFHLHPELELCEFNLITLCESKRHGVNCHLWFGHLGNYKQANTSVDADTHIWRNKLEHAK